MNLAEAGRMRELAAKVESQGKDLADLTRRFDDLSKLYRTLLDNQAATSRTMTKPATVKGAAA